MSSPATSSRRADWMPVVLLVLVVALCFADVLFSAVTFFYQDIQFLHYPGKIYLVRSLMEGDFAFWSPHVFSGYPLQAEPEVGPLYPFNLLFALPIAPYYAQTLFVVLHYILAAVFTYWLARRMEVSPSGSFVSGLTYACSGYLMAQLTNFSILTAVVWLPLILLLSHRAIVTGRFRHAVGAGIVVALFMLTSHPQIILLTFVVLGLFYLYYGIRCWVDGGERRTPTCTRFVVLLVLTIAVGAGLAAPQLWPAWELKQLSVLSDSLGYDFVTSYSLSPYRMVSFLFPNFLGNQATGYGGPAFFEEHHDYIGLLPLLLVVLAWGRRRNRNALFFGLLLPLSVVLSWGRTNPMYHVIAYLPLFNLFRVPARWLYPMTLSLAILAGFGWDQLLARRLHARFRRLTGVLLIGAGLVTVTLPWLFVLKDQAMHLTGWFVDHVYPSYAVFTLRSLIKGLVRFPDLLPSNWLAQALPFLVNPLIFFVVMLDLTALLIWLFATGRLSTRRFQVLGIALIALDLFLVGGSNINPVEPPAYFNRRPTTTFLQQNLGLYRVLPINQDGDPNLNLGHYFPLIDRIPSFGGSSSLTVRWFRSYRDATAGNPRLWDLAGIRYVIHESARPPEGFSGPLAHAFESDGLHVFENERVLPRAFLLHEAEAPRSDEAALARLSDPAFPLERVILLDDPLAPALLGSGEQNAAAGRVADAADIVDYSYNAVTVRVATGRPAFLFLSDNYYPGWEATVDGQPVKLYRADYMFRAVFLPPGEHTVTFTFRRPAFIVGVAVAGWTVAVLIAGALVLLLRRKRRRSPVELRPLA